MKILLSVKTVLNYLYNHLINLIWTKKIRFEDGTEMTTVPKGNSLYDIKILAQSIANKDWCCLSYPTRKDIEKNKIPTIYNDIENKLKSADKEFITNGIDVGYPVWYDETTQKYYFFTNNELRYSQNNNLSPNYIQSVDTQGKSVKEIIIGKNINVLISSTNPETYLIYDKSWNFIKEITLDNVFLNSSITALKVVKDYIVVVYSAQKLLFLEDKTDNPDISFDTLNIENSPSEQSQFVKISENYDGNIFFIINGRININGIVKYNILTKQYQYNLFSVAFQPINLSPYLSYEYRRNGSSISSVVLYNDKMIVAIGVRTYNQNLGYYQYYTAICEFDFNNTVDEYGNQRLLANVIATIDNQIGINDIFAYEDTFFVYTGGLLANEIQADSNPNPPTAQQGKIYQTNNFIEFTEKVSVPTSLNNYYWKSISNFFVNNDVCIVCVNREDTDGRYQYNSLSAKIYTKNLVINGSIISVNYHKYEDINICIKDNGTNDTNLDLMYACLGYANFFVIDTINETLALPRSSNLWTFMYVGDNYVDVELPNGSYLNVSTVAEQVVISNASITLDITKNTNYRFTNNDITDITLNSCQDSPLETVLDFSTGNTTPTLTDSSGITWVDGSAPVLSANKSYIIVIYNKKGFVREY